MNHHPLQSDLAFSSVITFRGRSCCWARALISSMGRAIGQKRAPCHSLTAILRFDADAHFGEKVSGLLWAGDNYVLIWACQLEGGCGGWRHRASWQRRISVSLCKAAVMWTKMQRRFVTLMDNISLKFLSCFCSVLRNIHIILKILLLFRIFF